LAPQESRLRRGETNGHGVIVLAPLPYGTQPMGSTLCLRRGALVVTAVLAAGFPATADALPPTPPSASRTAVAIGQLKMAVPLSMRGYSRKRFPHWISQGSGCDTRERVDLYRAKTYGARPTTPARLRELERVAAAADSRLRRAQAAQRASGAGD
jgi:hypothetical protein